MKEATLFSPEDLQLLRRPALMLFVSVVLAAVVYLGSQYMNTSAAQSFQLAQNQYVQVQTSIQQIASEESTFVEYIDRYRLMVEDGVFEDEDRLALLEFVQAIRQQSRLYPVELFVQGQASQMLAYSPEELLPGSEVQLRFSDVNLSFESLHEDDFANLMTQFLAGRGLFLPTSCQIQKTELESQFDTVSANLTSECNLIWFSLNLNPMAVEDAL